MADERPIITVDLDAKLLRWRRESRSFDEIARRAGMTPDELVAAYGQLGAPVPHREQDQPPEELRVAQPAKPHDWRKHYGEEK